VKEKEEEEKEEKEEKKEKGRISTMRIFWIAMAQEPFEGSRKRSGAKYRCSTCLIKLYHRHHREEATEGPNKTHRPESSPCEEWRDRIEVRVEGDHVAGTSPVHGADEESGIGIKELGLSHSVTLSLLPCPYPCLRLCGTGVSEASLGVGDRDRWGAIRGEKLYCPFSTFYE
jgi:hypothetical protein